MKDTFIKYKDTLYHFGQCKVFADCIRHTDWDSDDNEETIIMPNGEWEYVEEERINTPMTMGEWDTWMKEGQSEVSRKARERKERFEQEYPNWRDFPDNTIRHKYYEDNPI